MHRHFDRDLETINERILRMGAMVEDRIERAIRAMVERDTALAEEVIASDDEVNALELAIDEQTVELIATMQPTANDLRLVAAMMKITPELERVADLAQDVCERVVELNREPALKPIVPRLAQTAAAMVRDAMTAFARRDAQLARAVIARDDEVDSLTEQSFRELLTYMMEDSRNISRAIRLTFIGKYFERMGDAATNIAEMVVFLVEGKVIKHSPEDSSPEVTQ